MEGGPSTRGKREQDIFSLLQKLQIGGKDDHGSGKRERAQRRYERYQALSEQASFREATLISGRFPNGRSFQPGGVSLNAQAPIPVPKRDRRLLVNFMYENSGISLSELPARFAQKTGTTFDFKKWNYQCLTECLESLSDILYLDREPHATRLYLLEKVHAKKEREHRNARAPSPELELSNSRPSQLTEAAASSVHPSEHDYAGVDGWSDSDTSHFPDWGQDKDCENDIDPSQLGYGSELLSCGFCNKVAVRKTLILQCGHLVCRKCLFESSLINRKKSLLTCPKCQKVKWYHYSIFLAAPPFNDKSILNEISRLYKLVQTIPMRCLMLHCPWKNKPLKNWNLHAPVCPLLQRYFQALSRFSNSKISETTLKLDTSLLTIKDVPDASTTPPTFSSRETDSPKQRKGGSSPGGSSVGEQSLMEMYQNSVAAMVTKLEKAFKEARAALKERRLSYIHFYLDELYSTSPKTSQPKQRRFSHDQYRRSQSESSFKSTSSSTESSKSASSSESKERSRRHRRRSHKRKARHPTPTKKKHKKKRRSSSSSSDDSYRLKKSAKKMKKKQIHEFLLNHFLKV